MRLADFILKNIEPILQEWEDFAKTLTPAAEGMDSVALRDHAEQMGSTHECASALDATRSGHERARNF